MSPIYLSLTITPWEEGGWVARGTASCRGPWGGTYAHGDAASLESCDPAELAAEAVERAVRALRDKVGGRVD